MSDIPTDSKLVTPEQVSAITHLTPSEIRNLVRSGHLPKAEHGRYDLSRSISGAFNWYAEARKAPPTITAEELSKRTGLSDSSHRKLASKGFFPPPSKGLYQLLPTVTGLINYYRSEWQHQDKTLAQKRERKMDLEISLLGIEEAEKKQKLVLVEEMVGRLTPALAAMRQRVLSSTLTPEESRELLDDLGRILDDAIKNSIPGSGAAPAADTDPAAAANGQPMGG